MKKLLAMALSVFAPFCSSAEPSQPPIQEHIVLLSKLPFTDWTITKESSAVVLTSKFDVYFVGTISRPNSTPPFDENTPEEILRREGAPKKYVIRFEYGTRISREELERRLTERKPFADTLTHGASGKDTWSEAARRFEEIRVPRYDYFDFSIYRVLPQGIAVRH